MRLAADLGEFSLFVSGRPADIWWPDEVQDIVPLVVPPMARGADDRKTTVSSRRSYLKQQQQQYQSSVCELVRSTFRHSMGSGTDTQSFCGVGRGQR